MLRNAFTVLVSEIDVAVRRTSRSAIVREMLDYVTVVSDAQGYNVAQPVSIPAYLSSMNDRPAHTHPRPPAPSP